MFVIEQTDRGKPQRLEYFISLAKEGEPVHLEVTLRKQILTPKDSGQEPYRLKVDADMYFLMGDFNFDAVGEAATISKVYILGPVEESAKEEQERTEVANERLKMDYQRLKYAGIAFEEKSF